MLTIARKQVAIRAEIVNKAVENVGLDPEKSKLKESKDVTDGTEESQENEQMRFTGYPSRPALPW